MGHHGDDVLHTAEEAEARNASPLAAPEFRQHGLAHWSLNGSGTLREFLTDQLDLTITP